MPCLLVATSLYRSHPALLCSPSVKILVSLAKIVLSTCISSLRPTARSLPRDIFRRMPPANKRARTADDADLIITLPPFTAIPSGGARTSPHVFEGHPSDVFGISVLSPGRRIATACDDGHLRIFAPDGRGPPLLDIPAHVPGFHVLTSLGFDTVASGGFDSGTIVTYRATGEPLATLVLPAGYGSVNSIVTIPTTRLAVGTSDGAVIFVTHERGRSLSLVASLRCACMHIMQIDARENRLLVAGANGEASIVGAFSHTRLAVLRGHVNSVHCVALGKSYIATSSDLTIRLYMNDGIFAPFRILSGLHTQCINFVLFLSDTTMLSASNFRTGRSRICFISLPDCTPFAFIDVPIAFVNFITVTPDGRLLCAGEAGKRALIIAPPPAVVFAVQAYADSLFSAKPSAAGHKPETPAPPAPASAAAFLPVDIQSAAAQASPGKIADLVGLRARSVDTGALKTATVSELANVLAAAMIAFQPEFYADYVVLADCLRVVFTDGRISGDLILSYPFDKLMANVCGPLRKRAEYKAMGSAATEHFEWRLKELLNDLRGRD